MCDSPKCNYGKVPVNQGEALAPCPDCTTSGSPAGYSADEERKQLREAQAREVMPMIGPLLDAWEQVPNDMVADLCFHAPSLTTYMEKINHAMETAE